MVNLLDVWKANRPLAELWNVRRFNEDGYRRNTVVFACIVLKATSFMGPELCAYTETKDGEKMKLPPDHELSKLLFSGFGNDSQSSFMRSWSTNLDVAGNAYAVKIVNAMGMPIELKILRPDCIRPIPDAEGNIISYEYGL